MKSYPRPPSPQGGTWLKTAGPTHALGSEELVLPRAECKTLGLEEEHMASFRVFSSPCS